MNLMNLLFRDRSLFYKFLTFSIIPIVIAILFLSFSILNSQQQARIKKEKERTSLLTDLTILTLSNDFVIYNKSLLDNILNNLEKDNGFVCAMVVDTSDNRILSHTDHSLDGSIFKSDHSIPAFKEFCKGYEGYEVFGDIIISGEKYAVLKIIFSLKAVNQEIIKMAWYFLSIAFIAIFLGVLCSFFLSRIITKPIQALVEQTKIIGAGNLNHQVVYNSKDILGQLANEFNKMVMDLKSKQQQIMDNEARLRNLVENMPVMMDALDKDNNIITWNKECERVTGFTAGEIIGNTGSFEMLYPDEIYREQMIAELTALGYHFRNREYELTSKDGTQKTISWSNISDEHPIPGWHTWAIGMDVTDRKNAENIRKQAERELRKVEKQLLQTQRMEAIGKLAGGIAHDFNNILFPIMGYTELLLTEVPENSSTQKSLNKIYSSALRAKDLVTQILTFSRQEKGEPKLIKLQPIIDEVLNLIRATIPKSIAIKKDICPDCGVIKADPTQIHQIIMNLATNAYHAMEETGGELKISLEKREILKPEQINPHMEPGSYLCLKVSDTGVGIKKGVIKKIFDPFFTTQKNGKGTGLGLSVVHGIVSRMKGGIQVHSETGKGTQFIIFFPVESDFFEDSITLSNEKLIGGSERILLVDDEEYLLEMVQEMLEGWGYKVTAFLSSTEAFGAFRAAPDQFDLIITDMTMPEMSGDKLSSEIIKIRNDIPILLYTGYSERISREEAVALGIRDLLMKPVEMRSLAQKIREVFNR